MSVGLDLGTTEFRSLRDSEDELIARRCRAVYLVVRDTAGHRRLFENCNTHFATCGDNLIVFGDDAIECANMLDLQAIPLLRHGLLPNSDPVARQILALMIEAVLPPAERRGTVCCLTLPGGYYPNGDFESLDVRFLRQLVNLRGYSPEVTSPSLAIVLAELASSSFSGLGINLGATNCEIGVIHCGRELTRYSIAGNLSDLSDEILVDAGSEASSPERMAEQKAIWDKSCLRMLTRILTDAREALVGEGSIRLVPQPARIACTGGITAATGFADLFERAWSEAGWPIKTAGVHLAGQPAIAVARGCLIQAIMNVRSQPERNVA